MTKAKRPAGKKAVREGRRSTPPLALPPAIRACLLDLDGVLTHTADLHAEAWKRTFDRFLANWSRATGRPSAPFDLKKDYDDYVDGKPRLDGVRSFLASRGITLPEGRRSDPPTRNTVEGVGNAKNRLVLRLMRERGVTVYPGSLRLVRRARGQGLPCAVVSSSENCHEVLKAAGIEAMFDAVIDGIVARRAHLRGKPAPDTYLAAARRVRMPPSGCAVFEDALAGVEAGRAGKFGFVVGVDRVGQASELRRHGADRVVKDLAELVRSP